MNQDIAAIARDEERATAEEERGADLSSGEMMTGELPVELNRRAGDRVADVRARRRGARSPTPPSAPPPTAPSARP
jgi:hypothetical protein